MNGSRFHLDLPGTTRGSGGYPVPSLLSPLALQRPSVQCVSVCKSDPKRVITWDRQLSVVRMWLK
jgi:hypothetical protein